MLTATQNTQIIRNYLIAAVSVMLMSTVVADLFNNPARYAQQDKLDNYGRYISAGLVSYAKTSLNR